MISLTQKWQIFCIERRGANSKPSALLHLKISFHRLPPCLEGSVFTNKNTEGYPGKRFVGGCQLSDQAELLAVERVKKVFGAEHANIQSGNATIANMAVLVALLNPGDIFMGLALDNGGHLSHGAKFHFSGREFSALHYGVNKATERIDMEQVRQMAAREQAKDDRYRRILLSPYNRLSGLS